MGIKKLNFLRNIKGSFILFIFSAIILNLYILISINTSENTKKDIVRFHVVANSNSIYDQIVKFKVETNVKNYINSLIKNQNDTDRIIDTLKINSNKIIELSNSTLKDENANYTSNLKIGKIFFEDQKEDATCTMQSGTYNSAVLLLGDAGGKNCWSFISPTKENLKKLESFNTILPGIKNIYKDENKNIEDNNYTDSHTEYKSFLLELLNKI